MSCWTSSLFLGDTTINFVRNSLRINFLPFLKLWIPKEFLKEMHSFQTFYIVHVCHMTICPLYIISYQRSCMTSRRNPCTTGRKSQFYCFQAIFFSLERFREIWLDLWNVVPCLKVPHPFPCPSPDSQKGPQNKDCVNGLHNVSRWSAALKENSCESHTLEGKHFLREQSSTLKSQQNGDREGYIWPGTCICSDKRCINNVFWN